MKISTRIGVLRMTSTYTAVSWLTTGTRCARAAPSSSPITKEPAIATAETFSVLMKPWTSSSQLTETKAQRSSANGITVSQRRRPAARLLLGCLRADRLDARRARRRVREVVVGTQDVRRERAQEPAGHVRLE